MKTAVKCSFRRDELLTPSQQTYARPPITEAVIEIRFANAIEPDALRKASQRLARYYAHETPFVQMGVMLNIDSDGNTIAPPLQNKVECFRLCGADQQEIALLLPNSLIISQLAPYPGWDMFFGRFRRDWLDWKEGVGYNKVARVGVRYINRIDILKTNPTINESDYVNIWVQTPSGFGPNNAYAAQAVFTLPTIQSRLIMNTAIVLPHPIPEHVSFLIDLDIGRDVDVPQRDDEIYSLLDLMRTEKNRVFEECITEKTREMFR